MNSNQLFERRFEIQEIMAELKSELSELEIQLQDIFFQQSRDALRADGKDFGTTHVISGNQKVKVTIPKKVTWDQDKLFELLSKGFDEEKANHYGKITVSVEERKFNAAPPQDRKLLERCRSVEPGKLKIEVEKNGS
tara:strand:- start:14947 stop:15357 length:411 start_codon:yes stop_codon:yes gene_type:complete